MTDRTALILLATAHAVLAAAQIAPAVGYLGRRDDASSPQALTPRRHRLRRRPDPHRCPHRNHPHADLLKIASQSSVRGGPDAAATTCPPHTNQNDIYAEYASDCETACDLEKGPTTLD